MKYLNLHFSENCITAFGGYGTVNNTKLAEQMEWGPIKVSVDKINFFKKMTISSATMVVISFPSLIANIITLHSKCM